LNYASIRRLSRFGINIADGMPSGYGGQRPEGKPGKDLYKRIATRYDGAKIGENSDR
jgi:hypothetical protein